MCGIAGIISSSPLEADDRRAGQKMIQALRHRGPDGEGTTERSTNSAHLLLLHTRLAIIDLVTGQQPMSNEDATLWISFNGEIFNYRELRLFLEKKGHRFRTHSDTETILHLYEEEGIKGFLRLRGMFAFALWDEKQETLLLLRDTFGIKPLHYAVLSHRLLFASEAKALLLHPAVPREIDRQAFHDLLNLRFVPSPQTLWKHIRRVQPGELLLWKHGRLTRRECLTLPPFRPTHYSFSEAAQEFQSLFQKAVERHLVADVPVGVYLSGGTDSTAIALFSSSTPRPPEMAFTLGFGDERDEVEDARTIADRLGLRFLSTTLPPNSLSEYPDALRHVEEPQVNILQSFQIAAVASAHVKVVLSGLGGDELFGGYHSHRWMHYLSRFTPLSKHFEGTLARLRRLLSRSQSPFSPRGDLARRGCQLLLAAGRPEEAWGILRNVWDEDPAFRRLVYYEPDRFAPALRHLHQTFADRPPLEAAFDADFRFKLSDDYLAGEDRTSMAHGLEVRPPFLDLDLVAFVRTLPVEWHVSRGLGKSFLRRSLSRILPDATLRKPKWGFTFAVDLQWERSIRPYVQSRLIDEFLPLLEPVRPDYIRKILDLPPSRQYNWHRFFLWMLAGFVDWYRIFERE